MTRDNSRIRVALATGLLLAIAAAPAAAKPVSSVSVSYNIDVGPLTMTRVEYALNLKDGAASSRARIKSHGISRVFAEYSAKVEGESLAKGKAIAPVSFWLVREKNDKIREARVTWSGGRIDYAPRDKKPERRASVDNALNDRVADPMTAVLRIGTSGETPCPSVHQIFDGRDVFELSLTDKGEGRIKEDGYRGPVRYCEVNWTPIAGRAVERNEPRESYDVAFAPVGEMPNGRTLWLPVSLSGKLKGLFFKGYATKLRMDGGSTASGGN